MRSSGRDPITVINGRSGHPSRNEKRTTSVIGSVETGTTDVNVPHANRPQIGVSHIEDLGSTGFLPVIGRIIMSRKSRGRDTTQR